jgi:ATP-dependent Clp protease ATP-binding subunit ClpB
MDLNKLTLRSKEALATAQRLAGERNHQTVEPEHLLAALLADPEGVVYPLLHALGLSPRTLRDRVDERLQQVPRVYGPAQELRLSPAAGQVLDRAFAEAEALTD